MLTKNWVVCPPNCLNCKRQGKHSVDERGLLLFTDAERARRLVRGLADTVRVRWLSRGERSTDSPVPRFSADDRFRSPTGSLPLSGRLPDCQYGSSSSGPMRARVSSFQSGYYSALTRGTAENTSVSARVRGHSRKLSLA